jgi:hypothetical protein
MRAHARDGRAPTDEPPVPLPPAPAPRAFAADLLALQRSAGNQAVGRYLAREEVAPDESGTGTRHPEPTWKVTVSKIGPIDAQSVSWSGTGGTATGVTVVSEMGAHSPKLQNMLTTGTPVSVLAAHKQGFKHSLKKGLITSYATGAGDPSQAPMESWSVAPSAPHRLEDEGAGPGNDETAP